MPLDTVSFRGRTLRAYHMDTSAYGKFSPWAKELPIRPGIDLDKKLGADARVFLEAKGVIDGETLRLRGIQRDIIPDLIDAGFSARRHSLFGGLPQIDEVREAIGGRLMPGSELISMYGRKKHGETIYALLRLMKEPGYVKEWNEQVEWLSRGNRCAKFNLSGMYLNGLKWSGLIMPRADFGRAQLKGIDLRRAVLSGSHLYFADLKGADLRRADISFSWFEDVQLKNARLRGIAIDSLRADHLSDHPDRKSFRVLWKTI